MFKEKKYVQKTFKDPLPPETHVQNINFQDCRFNGCHWSECKLEKCSFERCTFSNCNLSLIKLPDTTFKNVIFEDSRLMGINWCDANWSKNSFLWVKHIDFIRCLLDHSLYIGLDLSETSFQNCRAHHLDFEGANLTQANFSGADLLQSHFINCDLTEADFTQAVNYAINAAHNILHKTRFSMPEAISLLYGLDIILEEF